MNLSRYSCFLYKGDVNEAAKDDKISGEKTGLGDNIPEHTCGGDGITEGISDVVPMDVNNVDEDRSKISFPC